MVFWMMAGSTGAPDPCVDIRPFIVFGILLSIYYSRDLDLLMQGETRHLPWASMSNP